VYRQLVLEAQPISFQTNLAIPESIASWYCVRVFGSDEPRQRAISGAFYFEDKPGRAPEPVKARIRVQVRAAGSGRALEATLTEVSYLGTQPQSGVKHRLPGGSGEITIPATARLRADAAGFEPVTLSPFFDHPALVETVTRLEDKDLLDWRTFERIRTLLGDVALTFTLPEAQPR